MTKFKKNTPIYLLFMAALLGIILSFITYRSSIVQMERENFQKTVRDYTKMKLESTRHHISDMIYDLNVIGELVGECDSLWDPEVKHILAMSSRMDQFSFTAVADQDGNGYTYHGNQFNIADKEYFTVAMGGVVAFSEVIPSKAMPGKKVQVVACPIWSQEHQVEGVVLGIIELEKLDEILSTKNSGDSGNLYIVDIFGNYISQFQISDDSSKFENFWEDLEALPELDKDVSEIKADFAQRETGEFCYSSHGRSRYGCYMPIGTRNWQIVCTVEDTALNEAVSNIFRVDFWHAVSVAACYLSWLICVIWYFRKANREVRNAHQAVCKNIRILNIVLEHSHQMVFEYDQKLRRITLQPDFPNCVHCITDAEITPEYLLDHDIVMPSSAAPFKQLFETIMTHNEAKAEVQLNTYRGPVWYRFSLYNIHLEEGITATIGFVEDITELKLVEQRAQRKLELQEALIAKALQYVKVDLQNSCVQEINGEEKQIPFGVFLKENVLKSVCPEDRKRVSRELCLDSMRIRLEEGIDSAEIQFRMQIEGIEKWVSCMQYCVSTNPPKAILVLNDIDHKKRQEIALRDQAEHDGLTGLYNAAASRKKIAEAITQGYESDEKQVLIVLDLDNYKLINDTFGHNCGDKVLVDVAKTLRSRFRSGDIVGRIGGDEFMILLRNTGSDEHVEKVLKELCKKLHRTYRKNGKEVALSASVGAARMPADGHTFAELSQKSDIALYQVKNRNKNGYKFYDGPEQV